MRATLSPHGVDLRFMDLGALGGRVTPETVQPLLAEAAAFRAELVLLDQWGQGTDWTAALDTARRLQASGAAVASFYPDLWVPAAPTLVEAFAPVLDALWLPRAAILGFVGPALRSKLVVGHTPLDLARFHPGDGPRDIGAGFVGTIDSYNRPRRLWRVEVTAAGLPVQFFLTDNADPGARTIEQYADLLRRMKVVVNFTMRPTGARILTGRTFESQLCGCLLLQEEDPDTPYFFQPWVHYLPFRSLADLTELLHFIEAEPELCQAIAAGAAAWAHARFTPEQFWLPVLDTALDRRADRWVQR